jgi:AcrR family transcriptional regulator
MATRVRRRARRGEGERLREEIVDAAAALLLETGSADAVSIRGVAEAVGVTPPSIYMHFSHKDELILEVCERFFSALDAVVEDAITRADGPIEAVKAVARAYIRFGLDHPEQYRLLFMTRTVDLDPDAMRERIMGASGFNRVVHVARACIDAGAFRDGDEY